ncbi:uncharacterized protein LOC130740183 [Lotus japonicus]|uniref:uncharacterized protein LOC130740183 n=1 Tax=Lotus japonicus TaxID=34305 RepID=UPI00258554AB|nr:uncharacterized protein LOC130740183 [Lotus japonicus]
MGKKRKLNIGHRRPENSNQHGQPNENDGIESSTRNAEETQSNPGHGEEVMHGSLESNSIPSDIETEEIQAEKESKRVRGPTRMLDVWDMQVGDFIIVNLDKYGRTVGEEATTLTRFIGSVVRRPHFAPINYISWKKMPKENIDDMLEAIESKFEFVPPINDTIREMLKAELNEKWRQWKSDIKSLAYNPSKTEEEIASKLPDDRVEPSQYRDLVHHWFSESGQKTSEINRRNRAKFEDVHCMGTKSLPRLIDEKKKLGKGVSPKRKEIYIQTRTRKDGTIVNEKAARVIEELRNMMRLKHLNQLKTHKGIHLGMKTYSLKCKDLIKGGVSAAWARFQNVKKQRHPHLKMKSYVIE